MQRDQKIGLALGILLIGATAAFFFRNEEAVIEPLPALRTGADLDREIAERDRIPYLQGVDGAEPRRIAAEPITANDPFRDDAALSEVLVPEPIGSEDFGPLPESLPATEQPLATVKGVGRHIVGKGETLSSIAAKYLGTPARFEEIYEANRDQLRTPNDLHVGMELRVPIRERVAERFTPASEAPRASESVPSSPKLFEPYRRSPFTPRGSEPQSATADPKSSAGRRLTQLPPKGDVVPR